MFAYLRKILYLCTLFEILLAVYCRLIIPIFSLSGYIQSLILPNLSKMMRKYIQLASVLLAAIAFSGCVTQKQMTYFRQVDSTAADTINRVFEAQIDPVVKAGDALSITVSALDQEAVVPYNLPTVVYSAPGSSQLTTTPSLQYYTVGADGNIDFPVLGKIQVLGLRTPEVANLIKQRLSSQLVDPMVIVQLINAKVTVMGEVNRPGQYTMTNGRMTLLDALGAAGDLSIYGKRDNILITRETNGKLEFHRLNLNSEELFTSPYYYLQQNDVIYVSPNKVRAVSSQNIGLWLSMVSTLASAATVIVTVVNAADN